MSQETAFKVIIESIVEINSHPNAERLELAIVKGWQCVVQKGAFKKGDLCVYIPIDSILPGKIEEAIFGADSKIKLHKSRVKTIKLRGAISQGLVVKPGLLGLNKPKADQDVTAALGITKYEPPQAAFNPMSGVRKKKPLENPYFHKYGGIENIKNYPDLFKEGEMVYVTEKIHGTNFRAGYVRSVANTFWRKILKLLGKLPEWEFVFGSNNVQLQQKGEKSNYYGTSVYGGAVETYKLRQVLQPGEVVYGEIYGDGIQKNYSYGCGSGERKLAIFDLKRNDEYVCADEFLSFCEERNLPRVPEIYRGPYQKETIKNLTLGNSVLAPTQKVREGVVVKPLAEEKSYIGRKFLKVISETYLLDDSNTDYH